VTDCFFGVRLGVHSDLLPPKPLMHIHLGMEARVGIVKLGSVLTG